MSKTIEDLRAALFDAIEGVKSGKLDIDRAKCVSDLAQVMVNSAKTEVDFIKVTNGKDSAFLAKKPELPDGITGIHKHITR